MNSRQTVVSRWALRVGEGRDRRAERRHVTERFTQSGGHDLAGGEGLRQRFALSLLASRRENQLTQSYGERSDHDDLGIQDVDQDRQAAPHVAPDIGEQRARVGVAADGKFGQLLCR